MIDLKMVFETVGRRPVFAFFEFDPDRCSGVSKLNLIEVRKLTLRLLGGVMLTSLPIALIPTSPVFAGTIGTVGGFSVKSATGNTIGSSLGAAIATGDPTALPLLVGNQIIPAGSILLSGNLTASPNVDTPYTHVEITFIPPNKADPLLYTISVPNDDIISSGLALGNDLTVVGRGPDGAFRWTPIGGVQYISTPGSSATAINLDGTVIVGQRSISGGTNAFRWTQGLGPVALGTLQTGAGLGLAPFSTAAGVSDDGGVVAGSSQTDSGQQHAFRWVLNNPATGTGTMSDLGTLLPGFGSQANGISGDGGVVIGQADAAVGYHAFRWTQGSGMQDIGTVSGRLQSAAFATNHDGSVVVGTAWSDTVNVYTGPSGTPLLTRQPPVDAVATRWTQATGNRDINTLFAAAGVSLGGFTLLNATAISADGQFIGGQAVMTGAAAYTNTSSYVIRYCDATVAAACGAYTALINASGGTTGTGTPGDGTTGSGAGGTGGVIAGITTPASVQASTDQLGDNRLRLMAQQYAMTAALLGSNERIGTGTEVGVFGQAGSVGAGAFGRIAFGNGFTLLGGLAYQDQHYRNVSFDDAGLGAGALRYVYDGFGWWRPFAEVGGFSTFDGTFSFKRDYLNGAGTALGRASTTGSISDVYGRLGSAFAVYNTDEFAVSAEVGQERLDSGAYTEPLSQLNPFQGSAPSAGDRLDFVKARAQYTHVFTPAIDATIWGAGATSFDRSTSLRLTVPGIGTLTPDLRRASWGEYGARVGYSFATAMQVDLFAVGVAGNHGIGSSAHVGADLRYRF